MSCSGSLKSLAKAQPHDSNFKLSQKIKRLNVTKSFNKSSAVGKLLWMAQLRGDLKYPVKEHSRSLNSPQDQDIKHLIHLLKYVNQTRDFVFVMEPQLPSGIRRQVSGSDCQLFRFRLGRSSKSSKITEVNKWFIGFSIQCQSSINQQN